MLGLNRCGGPANPYRLPLDGHFDIEPANWNTNNLSYEPETINDGCDWAMVPDGALWCAEGACGMERSF